MSIPIVMPRLSETMTDGKLLQWNVKVGDTVRSGDAIAEVEADKANMEIEAVADGTIAELHGAPGDTIAVGVVLAVVEPGEASNAAAAAPAIAAPAGSNVSPLVRRTAEQKKIPLEQVTGSGPAGEILMQDLEAYLAQKGGGAA